MLLIPTFPVVNRSLVHSCFACVLPMAIDLPRNGVGHWSYNSVALKWGWRHRKKLVFFFGLRWIQVNYDAFLDCHSPLHFLTKRKFFKVKMYFLKYRKILFIFSNIDKYYLYIKNRFKFGDPHGSQRIQTSFSLNHSSQT